MQLCIYLENHTRYVESLFKVFKNKKKSTFTCIVVLKLLSQTINLNLFSVTYIFSFNIASSFNQDIQIH